MLCLPGGWEAAGDGGHQPGQGCLGFEQIQRVDHILIQFTLEGLLALESDAGLSFTNLTCNI